MLEPTQHYSPDSGTDAPLFVRQFWFDCFEKHINTLGAPGRLPLTDEPNSKVLPFIAGKGLLNSRKLLSMSNYYSPVFGLINHDTTETLSPNELTGEALDFLQQQDSINLFPLYELQADAWLDTFKQIGFSGQRYQHSVNWFHDDIQSIEQYWSLRPQRLINTLRRKRDLMKKQGDFKTIIFANGSRDELLKLLIDYHHVYYHSWKQTEPYPAFIDSIAEYTHLLNELRLGVIYHQEKPIAAQLWFVLNETAFIFKLAHVEGYTKFSPGTVLTAAMLENVIEQDRVNRIDFLTGNDDYKQDWMSNKRTLFGIYSCNKRSTKGLYLNLLNQAGLMRKKYLF